MKSAVILNLLRHRFFLFTTSISTSVPSLSGSGKIAVSTPNGAGLSTDVFLFHQLRMRLLM